MGKTMRRHGDDIHFGKELGKGVEDRWDEDADRHKDMSRLRSTNALHGVNVTALIDEVEDDTPYFARGTEDEEYTGEFSGCYTVG